MRLAMVTEKVVRGDGQGRVAYEIVQYALAQGSDVTLFSDQADPDLIARGAAWVPIQPRSRRTALQRVTGFARLANRAVAAQSASFDIIQGFGYSLTIPHHVSSAQFVHDAWQRCAFHAARVHHNPYGLYQGIYTRLNCRWERAAYNRAQVIVACSTLVQKELVRIGVPTACIQVILNAVDTQEFRPSSASRVALGLPEGVPLALFAGDIRMPRKNLDTTLKALAQVPGVHLAVVGKVAGSPYPQLAVQLGISERVHFLDYRKDMNQIMRVCNVFVFPSRYEPFGIVLLEAMATGLPVITARSVGAAEIVTPESGIVLADCNDVASTATALRGLLSNPQGCCTMGEAGRAIAQNHTWSAMAEAYWRLFTSIKMQDGERTA